MLTCVVSTGSQPAQPRLSPPLNCRLATVNCAESAQIRGWICSRRSSSAVYSTRCALLPRSFAHFLHSTPTFSICCALFGKNTGGAGAGCTCSPLRTGGTPPLTPRLSAISAHPLCALCLAVHVPPLKSQISHLLFSRVRV